MSYFSTLCFFRQDYGIDYTSFVRILDGAYIIKKLPWKPKDGEVYYFPNIFVGTSDADKDEWCDDDKYDKMHYEAGMVCKTVDEAKFKAKIMLDAILQNNSNMSEVGE